MSAPGVPPKPADLPRWGSGAQLAAALGVTGPAVYRATSGGRIRRDEETGMYDLHECWERWHTMRSAPKGQAAIGRPREPRSNEEQSLDAREKEAKVRRMEADAELAELRVQEQSGLLVARERVERLLFDALRLVRDKIRVIPDDAPTLAHETDEHAIRTRLQSRIDDALSSVADDILATPDEDEEGDDDAASA